MLICSLADCALIARSGVTVGGDDHVGAFVLHEDLHAGLVLLRRQEGDGGDGGNRSGQR